MEATAEFPDHIRAGVEAAGRVELPDGPIDNVVVVGMGGSSIGGALAAALLEHEAEVPIQVVRDHTVPGFVGEGTLVVATSYSGGTQETLDAVQDAVHRDARLVAITTGGKLGYLAEQRKAPMVTVPTGYQPRAATGWLLSTNYTILSRALGVGDPDGLARAAKRLEGMIGDLADPDGRAAFIAESLDDGTVGVVGHDVLGVVARRWAGEINENAKRLAFHAVMPEMAHNQIIGWDGQAGNATLVLVRREDESNVEAARMSFLAERADNADGPVVQCRLGGDRVEQVLEGILVGDYVSLHLARVQGIDPEPVETIEQLKGRLRSWR